MHRTGGPPDRRRHQPDEAHVDESVTLAVTNGDTVAYWSREAQELLGYTPAEIIGRPLDDLFSTDGTTFRHRDGSLLDTRAHLRPLLDNTHQQHFLVTTVPSPGTGKLQDLMWWMLEQQSPSLSIYDLEARLLWANEATRRAVGFVQSEVRGRRPTEFLRGAGFEEAERRILRVAGTGEPEYTEVFDAFPREPRAHAWAVDVFPLKDGHGRVHAVGLVGNDYSEQHHSRERMALLSEARTRIGASLEVTGTAQELVDVTVTVSRFADFVSVDLLDDVFRGALPAPDPHTGPVSLRRAAQGGTRPLPPDAVLGIGAIHTHPQSSPVARCQANGRPVLDDAKDPEIVRWLAEDAVHAAYVRAFGTHSVLAVPIRARGVILGATLFLRNSASLDPFSADDLTVIEDLVARVGVCLDNARRYTHERGIALALQRSLLPRGPMIHPAVETASRYVPAGGSAGVGGDWFDVIPLPGARVGLVVGDVVGHGISASATMGRLRTAVRTLADIDLAPDELLTHLDDIVTHSGPPQDIDDADDASASEIPGDIGATCLYAVYDPVSGTCSLARAGHPAPILVGSDGTARVVDLPAGPPLGLGSLPFETAEFTVPEGSLLALFTDGLIESRHHDLDEGNRRLCQALARPELSLEALCDTVLDSQHRAADGDDVALLLIRTRTLRPESLASWDLPSDPAIVSEARKRTCDRLTEWGLEEASFVTELVVSELVTNAIRYGTSPIRLRLIKGRTLTCEVSDSSSTSPHLRRARLSDEGGRGLLLVAQLTERWGTRHTRAGKTIWAEQVIHTV
ncbi:SpoIIE family protein phosphatase [Streptomyces turgidiscabies]|uniref:PAS domain S-box n=1 Tax=Streptomyces turgidiscabies (strain Car8) TaxID=698760 RepID=L7EVA2_STRT8|nr:MULTISPECIES: SpoIIE family protein phosphatase [Streptomyces]ELP62596.1 PAS domain S-box [Streptomyces turgidiscabies Car8]MDX3496108.1 SpoIIE family protein phosphatase [Streptomyces turgidiscabies]GAQ77506.1 phosphoserine phosphatase RsbU [Streptomyces turgidiscabies]